jgi:hypothetical protein
MAIITFEIDLDDIRGAVHNLSITPSSSPTETQVLEYIEFAAAEINAEAIAAGIAVSGLVNTDPAFMLMKKAIINKVASDILVARNRGDATAGQYYLDNYLRIVETLRKFPQRIEADSEAGPDLLDYIPQQTSAQLQDIQWYSTITGKVFQGGY